MTDEDFDQLRAIADNIRAHAEDACYGLFMGGDPRDFTPDPDCATADEMEAHKAACEAWENGEQPERLPMIPADAPTPEGATYVSSGVMGKHVSYFGLGVQMLKDETLMKLAQDLDDWIDRARQVLP